MKYTLNYLLSAATASAWWAAGLWGHVTEKTNYTELWTIAVFLTILTLLGACIVWENEI